MTVSEQYDKAMQKLLDTKASKATDVIEAMAWGIAVAVNDREPDDGAYDLARGAYQALGKAGFRVVRL